MGAMLGLPIASKRPVKNASGRNGVFDEEDHLAVSFEMHLKEHSLDAFSEEKKNDFCRHVCDNLECDHVDIEKLNEGSVVIYAHAVGFFHEDHRAEAAMQIQRGQAVSEDVWGQHLIPRPPEHTTGKHRASHWLQTQRDLHLVPAVQPATAVKATTLGLPKRQGTSIVVTTTPATTYPSPGASYVQSVSRPMAASVSSAPTRSSVHFAPTPAN